MELEILKIGSACTGCSACYNACNYGALSMKEDEEGFIYPALDKDVCIWCKKCDTVCPELKSDTKSFEKQIAYYGWHNDDSIRKQSSSGGIFSVLAQYVLKSEGIVYGAVFDNDLNIVTHKSTDQVELESIRKSKYIQSNIGDTFRSSEKELNSGRIVLFVGTPCQITGLRSYLKKDYSNLITCAFICHGVPSIKFFRDHLCFLKNKMGAHAINCDFRPKSNGWSRQMLSIKFANGKRYARPFNLDSYFNAFYKNLSLRKSCYNCNYAEKQHSADITLADFWGYFKYNPAISDDNGLSLILANTQRGNAFLIQSARNNATINPLEWRYAEYVFKSRKFTYNIKERNSFFNEYLMKGYKKVVHKYKLTGSYREMLKYWLSTLRRRLGLWA